MDFIFYDRANPLGVRNNRYKNIKCYLKENSFIYFFVSCIYSQSPLSRTVDANLFEKTIENIIGCASTGARKELLLLPNGDCVEGHPCPVCVGVVKVGVEVDTLHSVYKRGGGA